MKVEANLIVRLFKIKPLIEGGCLIQNLIFLSNIILGQPDNTMQRHWCTNTNRAKEIGETREQYFDYV